MKQQCKSLLCGAALSPAQRDGSLTTPLARGLRKESRSAAGWGVSKPDPMDFKLVQMKKALLGFCSCTDEDKGLLLTVAHSGFAPEVCRWMLIFPDEAGPAGETELGAFVLTFHECQYLKATSCRFKSYIFKKNFWPLSISLVVVALYVSE